MCTTYHYKIIVYSGALITVNCSKSVCQLHQSILGAPVYASMNKCCQILYNTSMEL